MRLHIPSSLHYRKFRLLWIGQLISAAGSDMQTWALFWHIRELTEAPIALGAVGLARIVPIVVFSLIGGSIADALNRKTILYVTQSIMALTAFTLFLLTVTGNIVLWHMYALTAIQALALSFDSPARQSLVPNLLPKEELPNAFSMTSIAFQIGSVLGPALSGFVIAFLGQSATYFINGLSYGAIFVALFMMGHIPQQIAVTGQKVVSIKAIREGIDFIISQPMILSTMLIDFFATFFSATKTLMPIVARDVLKVGAVEYGWLSASISLGAAIASLVVSQMKEIRKQGLVFLVSVMIFGLSTILFGLSRNLMFAMFALMMIGAADSVSMIIRNTIRQLMTPDYIRGRMISINQIFFMGGPQLGEIEAGLVAQFFGAPVAIVSGGVGCMLAVAWVARRWPMIITYNGDEAIEAGDGVKP